jgi:hypothetical protein
MAATPYDFTSPSTQKRRFRLPRLGAAGFGGGLGLLIVALGLLAIGLGWNGMAGGGGEVNGVPNLNAQLPWLLSGGILGLALVVFGTAMIVVQNARSDRARLEAKLDELVDAMGRGGSAAATPYPSAPAYTPATSAGGGAAGSATTTVTTGQFVAGPSAYHRPDCRLVQGRDDVEYISSAEAASRELKACRVCKPAESRTR